MKDEKMRGVGLLFVFISAFILQPSAFILNFLSLVAGVGGIGFVGVGLGFFI